MVSLTAEMAQRGIMQTVGRRLVMDTCCGSITPKGGKPPGYHKAPSLSMSDGAGARKFNYEPASRDCGWDVRGTSRVSGSVEEKRRKSVPALGDRDRCIYMGPGTIFI